MDVDLYPGTGLEIADAAVLAALVERSGLGGLWALEASREPFSPLAVAALNSSTIQLRTAVAVAFARNPMVTAQLAHELARVSGGRFALGLGSQVRAHIERRFGETWSEPVERMGEYLDALRAIWACWNTGDALAFDGRFYRHTLMTPMFDPGPSGHPAPAVHLAAVGPKMVALAATKADGLVLHPLSSPRSIRENVLPQVEGVDRSGAARLELSCPVLVVTGTEDHEIDQARRAVRKQVAFYASTPAYRWVLDLYDEGERADRLRTMSRAGKWDAMTDLVTDELLTEFSVEAPAAELVTALRERFGDVLDRVGLYSPSPLTEATLTAIADSTQPARSRT